MDKIKLIIWDLDETFWKGTLSEEGVELIDEHVQLVKELTDRGIMNSIVSKNDFEQAKSKLEEAGVWDYFIFSSIEWAPKGPLVKKTIEDCQLRAPNVLFLDDNHMNLEEAKFYCPELHVKEPNFIPQILGHTAFKGKDDRTHSRLKQYKILEKKAVEKKDFINNEEFLRSSEIKIQFITDIEPHTDRLTELLNRTNQLNYTKKRLEKDEVVKLINDPTKKALIRVEDKFGDYGIVGFYSLNKSNNRLSHFTFSCRILNLGVVQFLFQTLGCPGLTIVPDVAESVDKYKPDWISVTGDSDYISTDVKKTIKNNPTIFFKGSCDLGAPVNYLHNRISVNLITEFHFVNKLNFDVRSDHTYYIKESITLDESQKNELINKIPYIEKETYSKAVFNQKYDLLVYSVLTDFFQNVYKAKSANIHVPYGYDYRHLTDPANIDDILAIAERMGRSGITKEFLNYFYQHFESLGCITPEEFIQNLHFIRNHIPIDIPILFLNGAEVEAKKPLVKGIKERVSEMNRALEKFVNSTPNCYLLDIREIIYKKEHLSKEIINMHYTRERYFELGEALFQKVESLLEKKIIEPAPLGFQIQMLLFKTKKFILNNNLLPKPLHNGWRFLRGREPVN